jgi:hypothetical protein
MLPLPAGNSLAGVCSYEREVVAAVQRQMPRLLIPSGNCPLMPTSQTSQSATAPPGSNRHDRLVVGTAVNQQGNPVPPAAAAKSILAILGQTQTVSIGPGTQGGTPGSQSGAPSSPGTQGGTPGSQSGAPGSKQVPLGELISVNLELAGLQGQPVLMSWSIFQEGSHTNLFGKWLNDFAAYRLESTTNDDTGTLEMWIPLPKLKGPFFIHLSLTTADGVGLASADSGPFD